MPDFPPERRSPDIPLGDTARILAVLYVFGFLGMVLLLTFREIPSSNKEIVIALVSMMGAAQTGVLGYYFGYSRASEATQKALALEKAQQNSTILDMARGTTQQGDNKS